MHVIDKGLVSRRYKELLQLNKTKKKKKIQCKKGSKDLSRHMKEDTIMGNENKKRRSLPLLTREMKIKTVVRCHFTSTGRPKTKKIGNAASPSA